jgi:hypothetical protein
MRLEASQCVIFTSNKPAHYQKAPMLFSRPCYNIALLSNCLASHFAIMSAGKSLSPSSEDYALAARLTPESFAGAEPPPPQGLTTRFLVAGPTGVQDPSHTLITETIIASSKRHHVPQLLDIEEQHQPGVNDLMTGAISPLHQQCRTPEELASMAREDNNSTVCRSDLRYLGVFMPYKLFRIQDIAQLNVFHAPENVNHLPTGFHTTTLGLKVVWWVIWKDQEEAVYGDEQLLLELLKVGGLPSEQETACGILYPEDLVPCTSQDEWDDDHRKYWRVLGDLARTRWGEEEAQQDKGVKEI